MRCYFIYRFIGLRFDLSRATLFAVFLHLITVLNGVSLKLLHGLIKKNTEQSKFVEIKGIVGAVDGTYVKIKASQENREVYINRKYFHTVIFQGIYDKNFQFINCFTGYLSFVSNTRILCGIFVTF